MDKVLFLKNNKKNSVIALLLTNLIVIVLAVWQNWDLLTMAWIYWFQSVIIGLFQVKKMLDLENFSTRNFEIYGQSVLPNQETKIKTVIFFIFHYGFFHFTYAIFLYVNGGFSGSSILVPIIIFFINHLFSYKENKELDKQKRKNIGHMMSFPYLRIIPMHLIVVFGSLSGTGSLVFFLILKTIADVVMHLKEHKV